MWLDSGCLVTHAPSLVGYVTAGVGWVGFDCSVTHKNSKIQNNLLCGPANDPHGENLLINILFITFLMKTWKSTNGLFEKYI